MNEDERLRERFRRVGFAGEPPMASTAADDLARGRRHLRRRRAAALSGGVVGMVAVAAGVALALPGGGPADDLPVAGGDSATTAPPTTTPTEATPAATPSEAPHETGFPITRELLRGVAAHHFDPDRQHLNNDADSLQSGGVPTAISVGTKLGWTNAGEDGEGLVQVGVTTPGYVGADKYAVEQFTSDFGCDLPENCYVETVPGSGETVLVSHGDPTRNLLFAVSYERDDGSMVGVAVYDLFGNNSITPVSNMDISLKQAFAFVTDPALRVDPREAELAAEGVSDEPSGTATTGE